MSCKFPISVVDPGFPVGGGRGPRRGGMDSRGGYVSQILHVKTKESGPLGGRAPARPPKSANEFGTILKVVQWKFMCGTRAHPPPGNSKTVSC